MDKIANLREKVAARPEPVILLEVSHYQYYGRGEHNSWCETYDLRKLMALDDYELTYVARIIESALDQDNCTVYTSMKYSFQDCQDWYEGATVCEIPPGATIIYANVES